MMDLYKRVADLEREIRGILGQLSRLFALVRRAEQGSLAAGGGSGGGGGGVRLLWARVPSGGVGPAVGGWFGTFAAASFASDVCRLSGGAFTAVAEAATVYWPYLDGADAGSLVPCLANGDGTYTAVTNSCTPIPEDV